MIRKIDIEIGNKYSCDSLLIANKLILTKNSTHITIENYESPLDIGGILVCNLCKIEVIPKLLTSIKQNRLDLISDLIEEKLVPKLEITEQDSSTIEDLLEQENYSKDTEILHALDQCKDFLHQKLKYKSQQVQAKKDMNSSYKEAINIVNEEIDALIKKIDSLKDQLKIKKASK